MRLLLPCPAALAAQQSAAPQAFSQPTQVAQPVAVQAQPQQPVYVAPQAPTAQMMEVPVSQAPVSSSSSYASVETPVSAPIQSNTSSQSASASSSSSSLHASSEDRSDFDRFMSDRNAYNNQASQEETNYSASQQAASQQPAPSRLIQQIRDAANRYENTGTRTQGPTSTGNAATTSESGVNSSNTRAKSIAEKLGFINFDEDEFDTPSYLRKEEKVAEQRPAHREFNKNIDL